MHHLRGICDVLDLSIGQAMGEKSAEAKTDLEQVAFNDFHWLTAEDQEMVAAMIKSLRSRTGPKTKK